MGCINTPAADIQTQGGNTENGSTQELPKKTYSTLILGVGKSGKSATFQSIKLMNNGVTKQNLEHAKTVIRQNCVAGILTLLKHSQALYDENPSIYQRCLVHMNDKNISDIQLIVNYSQMTFDTDSGVLDYNEISQVGQSIETMWKLDAVKETFKYRLQAKYHLSDNIDYFLNKVTEIMSEAWIVTKEDLMKIYKRNTGITNYKYNVNDFQMNVFDIGVQRNECKKWMPAFDNVSCVIFVMALSGYCKVLFEDERCIHLEESFELFKQISNSKLFRKSKLILFLNKKDLFKEYLKFTPLSICFDDEYKGRNYMEIDNEFKYKLLYKLLSVYLQNNCDGFDNDIPLDVINIIAMYFDISEEWLNLCVKDGIEFIKQKCISIHTNTNRILHVFETTAILPEHMKTVMNKVHHIVNDPNCLQTIQ